MNNNLKRILEEFEDLKGQFVINGTEVMRYIAVATDDEDYYHVLYDGRKVIWSSCVGSVIPLKGRLAEKDYHSLVRLAQLNDFDQQEDESRKNAEREHITKCGENDKYLTPFYWDFI
jgi:hypothetical protein